MEATLLSRSSCPTNSGSPATSTQKSTLFLPSLASLRPESPVPVPLLQAAGAEVIPRPKNRREIWTYQGPRRPLPAHPARAGGTPGPRPPL